MKLLVRLGREAIRHRKLYVIAILSTLGLTAVTLAAPRVLSSVTGLVREGITEDRMQTILKLALVLLGLYLLRVLFRFLSGYLAHKAAWHLVGDMRTRVYDKMQRLDISFFHGKQTGDLMSRVINDTRDLELLYAHIIPDIMTSFVTFAGVLCILLSINPKLALITCLPIPLVFLSGFVFTGKVQPFFRANQKKIGEMNALLQDNLSGIHEIQSFGQEEYETERVNGIVFEQVGTMLEALKASAVFHPVVELISSLGTVLVVVFGGKLALKGDIQVEDIVAFLLYLGLFYTPVSGLANLLENASQSMAGAERVVEILDTDAVIRDLPGAEDAGELEGAVRFENVSFSYVDDRPVLKNVSFACEPGQMIALVGPTGVGKTTLTQLISRFYEPDEGRILIDGKDIREMTVSSLRRNIAPVLQDTFLFNGTVAENIRYARPDATGEEVEEAAKAANIHEDIVRMPDGYDTRVGERGVLLSGGQKQRIAIARAILRRSPVIILDEATASVDVETERQIQAAIAALSGKRTVIAIAHRLSTIRNADRIIVLEDGEIAESGTHEELVTLGGIYARLNGIQSGN